MGKRITLLSISMCFILFLTGCNASPQNFIEINKIENEDDTVYEALQYLISDECDGRLIGTEGNKKAKEYIVSRFKDFSIEPYNNSFYHPYLQQILVIDSDKMILELKDTKNNIIKFEYGKDFMDSSICPGTLRLPIGFDAAGEEDCILVAKAHKDDNIKKSNVKGILISTERLKKGNNSDEKYGDRNVFNITEEVYEILKSNPGGEVHMSSSGELKEIEENNVIGIIKGKDSSKAFLITAHLDHVGSIGESIWKGAYDNSSGVSILLDTARRIGEYSKNNELPNDIIFSGINSEETFLYGSKILREEIFKDYDFIANINMDCIGHKGEKKLFIDYQHDLPEIKLLTDKLNSFFNDSGIKSTPAYAEYISDHASFPVGINITTGYKDIHILEDTIDILDIDFMENISEMLAKFLIKTSSDSIILGEKHDKIYDAIRREAKNMNFGEYKFIEVENKNYYVMGSNLSGAKDEVDQHFGNSFDYIPDKLGDLKLDKIEINAFRSNYFNTPKADEHQTNMIYKRKGLIRDINNINIFYQNSDNYDKVIIQFDSFIKDNDIERDVEEEISGQAFEDRPFIETKNKYYLNAAIEADGYDELTVKHEVSDKIFIIRIYGSRLEDKLDYIQKQKVESFIKENNIDDIILALVKTLSQ